MIDWTTDRAEDDDEGADDLASERRHHRETVAALTMALELAAAHLAECLDRDSLAGNKTRDEVLAAVRLAIAEHGSAGETK